MTDDTRLVLQIGASLLGGGALGAIITAIVTSYRGGIQPVAQRVEVSPLFTSSFTGTSFSPSVTVSDGTADFNFPNLYVADVQLVNRGNRDMSAFVFGITLASADKAVHLEPYGLDRHHVLTQKTSCTPASPNGTLDIELRPFNRQDSYTMKVFIVASASEPGPLVIGSSEPVRFTEIPSVAETLARAASTLSVKIGPLEVRLPR